MTAPFRVLLLFLVLAVPCRGAHVIFNYSNTVAQAQSVRQMWLFNVTPTVSGDGLITKDRVVVQTGTAGSVTVSNVISGNYRAEFRGPYITTTNWFSFPDTNGLIIASAYRTTQASDTNGIPNAPFVASVTATNSTNSAGVVMAYPSNHRGYVTLSIGTNISSVGEVTLAQLAAATNGHALLADVNAATNGHALLTDVNAATNGLARLADVNAATNGLSSGGTYIAEVGDVLTLTTNNGTVSITATNLAHHRADYQYEQAQYFPLLTVDTNSGNIYPSPDWWYDGTRWILRSELVMNSSGATNLLEVQDDEGAAKLMLDSSGNLTATKFIGDGSELTGVSGSQTNVAVVVAGSNVTVTTNTTDGVNSYTVASTGSGDPNAITNNHTADVALLGSNYLASATATNLTITGTGTNQFGASAFTNGITITGTGTNEFGYSKFTNITSGFLYQIDGTIIASNPPVSTSFTNTTIITTNLTVENITNTTLITTNISAKVVNATYITASDGVFTNGVFFKTNSWAGPTNTLPMHIARQRYDTYTPISITGITSKSNTVCESVLLTIKNLSSSNITVYLDGGFAPAPLTQIVTNGGKGKFSVEYDPAGETNYVFRHF